MNKFPDGFLWGAATAAHQVEGNQDNDWSNWEPTIAHKLARNAHRRLSDESPVWSQIKAEAKDPDNYISGAAVDHYNLYKQDIDILKQLSLNTYRFSIEWSRIEPKPGIYDQEQLDHYKQVINYMKSKGIKPHVTLHHFTNPKWLEDYGGWHDLEVIDRFTNYAKKVLECIGDDIDMISTINEPGSYLFMRYLRGNAWPAWPNSEFNPYRFKRSKRNMIEAHKEIYNYIKQKYPKIQVGLAHALIDFQADNNFVSKWIAQKTEENSNWNMIDSLLDYQDYIGVNYYIRLKVSARLFAPTKWIDYKWGEVINDMGWGVHPKGIYELLKKLRDRYPDKPIQILENGIPDGDDTYRSQFIQRHLANVKKAIDEGVNVQAYYYWSLLDNFEWSDGFWPKFGLIEVDRQTQNRTIRGSAQAYSAIARNNSLD